MALTNFGKKTAPTYQIKEDSSELTWDQIIRDENDYVSLVEDLGGKAVLNAIPAFGGVYSEGYYGTTSGIPYLQARISTLAEGQELLAAYGPKLEAAGFTKSEETDTDGNTYSLYTKTVGTKKLTLEPINGRSFLYL